jgi:hypothetical protein
MLKFKVLFNEKIFAFYLVRRILCSNLVHFFKLFKYWGLFCVFIYILRCGSIRFEKQKVLLGKNSLIRKLSYESFARDREVTRPAL